MKRTNKLNYIKAFIYYFNSYNKLMPIVIQELLTKELLMLGYADIESIYIILESGYVSFFSRSKSKLWSKGETSGYLLAAYSIYLDCDKDSILVCALLKDAVCHLGNYSCFYDCQ